eukprot:6183805-Pleurochrysis_carterae.AAC.4
MQVRAQRGPAKQHGRMPSALSNDDIPHVEATPNCGLHCALRRRFTLPSCGKSTLRGETKGDLQ